MKASAHNRASVAIAFAFVGILAISLNDMLIKHLSGGYPLHEIVFFRSSIALMVTLIIVQFEGGWHILRTDRPGTHLLRGLMVIVANMSFFLALAALPLADVTALFFAAPLFITLLSIPLLKEKVGPIRMTAVVIGFIGVLIMQRPWQSAGDIGASRLVLLLPVLAGFTYALTQVMTRKLGATAKASTLAVYIQATFSAVSLGFLIVAGDGSLMPQDPTPSMAFLLRAWVVPEGTDLLVLIAMGVNGAAIGYCLSQAYRLADAATIAPFEYIGLPLAVFWGWIMFGDLPVWEVWVGIALILASGLFVFFRERSKAKGRSAPVHAR